VTAPRSPLVAGEPLVLVAEDHPVARRVIVRLLEQRGCQVHIVTTGSQAVIAAKARAYDLILLDCRMPTLDGFSAAREIRRLEGTGPRTPIIALTSLTVPDDWDRARAAGMNDYLTKPVRAERLGAAIERWTAPATGWGGDATAPGSVDTSMLGDLIALSPESGANLAEEIIELFYGEAPARLAQLQAGVEKGDPVAITRAAHALKGGAGNLGAVGLAGLCAEVERLSREGEVGSCAPLIALIRAELPAIRPRLERAVAALTARRVG
jgi:CheY-like chemotaxis protein